MELKGTTKHVLAFLSFHMNKNGGSCFPSHRTLATEAGLSRRSVYEHLKIAEDEGWVSIVERGLGGQEWKRHGYKANIPEKVGKEIPHVINEGGEGGSPRFNPRISQGGESNDIKVGKEVPLSTSMSTSVKTSATKKSLKKPKSTKSGKSSLKRKAEAKNQNRMAATEIYDLYLTEIKPEDKNTDAGVHNISTHLKEHSRDDLVMAIMNYKPKALGRDPGYRKAPSNFFGIKKGNKFFIDYLPCNFVNPDDNKKFPDWH